MNGQPSRRRRLLRLRTPIIGALSLAMLLWAAVDIWEVEPAQLVGALLVSVGGVLLLIGAAFVVSLLLRWLRRRRH